MGETVLKEKCTLCNGTGKEMDPVVFLNKTCTKCKGAGVVESEFGYRFPGQSERQIAAVKNISK